MPGGRIIVKIEVCCGAQLTVTFSIISKEKMENQLSAEVIFKFINSPLQVPFPILELWRETCCCQ
jgi:hypothetical protein